MPVRTHDDAELRFRGKARWLEEEIALVMMVMEAVGAPRARTYTFYKDSHQNVGAQGERRNYTLHVGGSNESLGASGIYELVGKLLHFEKTGALWKTNTL